MFQWKRTYKLSITTPFDPASPEPVVPFSQARPSVFPDGAILLARVRAWLQTTAGERAAFDSAEAPPGSEDEGQSQEGHHSTACRPTRLPTDLDACLERSSPHQDRSDPSGTACSSPIICTIRSKGEAKPAAGLPSFASMVGPPPKARHTRPPALGTVQAESPARVHSAQPGWRSVAEVLQQQGTALTALVSHFISQASDAYVDFGGAALGSSELSSKGSAKREKLQAELGARKPSWWQSPSRVSGG